MTKEWFNFIISSCISEHKSDLEDKLQTYDKINGSYTETFWKTNEQRNKIKNSQHYS